MSNNHLHHNPNSLFANHQGGIFHSSGLIDNLAIHPLPHQQLSQQQQQLSQQQLSQQQQQQQQQQVQPNSPPETLSPLPSMLSSAQGSVRQSPNKKNRKQISQNVSVKLDQAAHTAALYKTELCRSYTETGWC